MKAKHHTQSLHKPPWEMRGDASVHPHETSSNGGKAERRKEKSGGSFRERDSLDSSRRVCPFS